MTETTIQSTTLAELPKIGEEFAGGIFAGVITQRDGSHVAVVLLSYKAQDVTWQSAMKWAEEVGGQLPTRPIAAMLFANVKSQLTERWHWTCEEYEFDASCAWHCYFTYGTQNLARESFEGCAVAVRTIPFTA